MEGQTVSNTSENNFADRLLAAIDQKGAPVCVGLDPVYERLPGEMRQADASPSEQIQAMGEFCRMLIELVAPHVPAVKPQEAYFERYGAEGLDVYFQTVTAAKAAGLLVIGDAKRGDIGSTAQAYADAHLRGPAAADALTVNGYFGGDGTQPFIDAAVEGGRGIFALVRTSNPGGAAVQDFVGANGRKFFLHMAQQVAEMGDDAGCVGHSGYSCVGAVVGATYPDEARQLREVMPKQIFLVPGYGAQGATADDCAASFDTDGRGAIVNASRSVIYAFMKDETVPWQQAVERGAKAFAADISRAVGG